MLLCDREDTTEDFEEPTELCTELVERLDPAEPERELETLDDVFWQQTSS